MKQDETYLVVSIDDHPLYRKGIADLLDMDENLQMIGEAADGMQGLELVLETDPDIVLLDIDMKGTNGIETLKAIKSSNVETLVLMLTVSDNEDDIVAALRSGADGYLLKDMEPEDMLAAIHEAIDGKIAISKQLTQMLAYALRSDDDSIDDLASAGLTNRELEILKHIAKGESNKVIADNLDISAATVKVHVKHILKKLNLRSRVEAAVWLLNLADPDQLNVN
ncbi:two-component system response regulator NarL [Solemya velum gill symbiont]|uniref:Response regulator n=2 Tax=Solemya velum gill symbiont TaxID=2340 RepID=A0A0B0H6K8_SOVGS|nr:two-component system response regulator NarL [Solemya velum gill symbiont]KHF25818.1 response regulator [Solemya velum gill symbiont]OOY34523.1 two-component system response regulator NarL [Solemya velum gill symbiont]OOY37238.1 two-component system response regulator NarL [Solemya velum gill symbiont]OOY41738.1 two-component system response regulator NarL [Solemya velum gill symbiont]OOY47117.1 two-component system response regulator NarL [Solemya velum gill symbiont]